jgi:hypothetical protein
MSEFFDGLLPPLLMGLVGLISAYVGAYIATRFF